MLLIQIVRALCETLIDLCKHNWAVLLTDVLGARQRGVSVSESPGTQRWPRKNTHNCAQTAFTAKHTYTQVKWWKTNERVIYYLSSLQCILWWQPCITSHTVGKFILDIENQIWKYPKYIFRFIIALVPMLKPKWDLSDNCIRTLNRIKQ